jgi:hypothetical protein
MFTRARPRRTLLILTATLAVMPLAAALTAMASAETAHEAHQAAAVMTRTPSTLTAEAVLAQITATDGTLRFEIAEDGTRFVWADQSVFTDRHAAYGAPFITQGYIYPAGILSATTDGINADGSPQFPEKVAGEWTCYGWYVGGGAQATNGPWVLATQIYQFGSEWGAVSLVSEGYVSTSSGRIVDRAITGGTGPFAAARGEVWAVTLGINETSGSNARYEVRLEAP